MLSAAYLAGANNLDDILHIALQHTSQMVNGQAGIFLVKDGALELRATSPGFSPGNAEMAAARWACEHHQPAGRDSNTHFESPSRHLPLTILNEVIGILSVAPSNNQHLTSDQRQVVETSASLTALAIERIRLTEQANQAQVLRATEKLMTALFNSLSHDLRTPLASVTGVLSSLREDETQAGGMQILDQDTRHILLETAWEESQRLNRLVGNLLDMTRLEAGAVRLSRAPCDIQDVIGSAIAQLAERLAEHPVRAKIHSDLPLVSADFVLLTQVLVNLFDNSVKYSPSGTTIQVNARQQDDNILIQVSNAGPDIPASDLERVFDKFYRVEKPDQVSGTGLGLAICKGIVEVHGGRIWADNRPEGGPIFSILLPVNPPEGEDDRMTDKGARILVVDDDRSIRRFLRAALTAHDFTIFEAATGEEALAASVQEHPDVIILDLGLPDMDGVEITRRLREWTATPIIILSVRESEKDKIDALDAGADDYLTKPFGVGELLARIRVCLRHSISSSQEPVFEFRSSAGRPGSPVSYPE